MNLFKSALHNIGVVLVGLGIASIGAYLDSTLGVRRFHSVIAIFAAVPLLLAGFLLRVWATLFFYKRSDLAETSESTHHLWPLSFFTKSALSWKRVYLLRRRFADGIAQCCCHYRPSPPLWLLLVFGERKDSWKRISARTGLGTRTKSAVWV